MNPVNKVEAVLFASGKALDEAHIKELTELKPKETRTALEALQKMYVDRDGALFIWNESDKWKINVKEEYISLVKTLAAETELERAVLETLAIIAYRSPVLQTEVIKARGTGAYEYIGELVEKGFVTKEREGRSFKLKITDKFYHYFDVAGDSEIRDVLAKANMPDPEKLMPKEQKKLGDLDVVDAETDEEAEVDKIAREERQTEIHHIQETREDDKKNYLTEFDDRLGEVSGRINESEKYLLREKAKSEEAARESEDAEEDVETDTKDRESEEGSEEKAQHESDSSENREEEKPKEPEKEKDYDTMDPQALAKDIEERITKIDEEKRSIDL